MFDATWRMGGVSRWLSGARSFHQTKGRGRRLHASGGGVVLMERSRGGVGVLLGQRETEKLPNTRQAEDNHISAGALAAEHSYLVTF